jgi:Protein of unknown function (DUF3421)
MKVFSAIAIICLSLCASSQAQEWIQWNGSKGVPNNQMPRGREANYMPLYIIRGTHEGDLLPGKYNGDWGRAYIPYNGGEHVVDSFEVRIENFLKLIFFDN